MDILLADDHGLFRDSLSIWLEQLPPQVCVTSVVDFSQAQTALQEKTFQLIILDLYMPGMQGAQSVKQLCQHYSTPLIIVSAEESSLVVQQCLQAGAKGYVPKSLPGKCILDAVNQVLSGRQYLPADMLLEQGQTTDLSQLALSDKQLQILELLTKGKSNREIADTLFLSEGTVKQYVTKLLRLLEVDNRVQASIKGSALFGISSTS
ncbi:MAG: response regulator transcription factor [Pseudomonadales bacterium]